MGYEQLLDITNQRITCTSDNIPQNAHEIALQLNIRLKNHIECKHDFNEENYPLKKTDAVLAMNSGEYTIYYDENNPYSNFAIAHEIAHYLLGHAEDGAEQHHDAQLMAAILVIPPNKISFKDIKSSTMLAERYKIPFDVADRYWHELCKHKNKIQAMKPKIVLISGVALLLAISSAYYIGKTPTSTEIEASRSQPTIIHTTSPTIIPVISNSESIDTVYVTPFGEKYHKSTCRHIQKSTVVEFSVKDAINAGYEPCKDCMR